MKHIYLFLLLMACGFSFAQDPRLFENNWYLTNVIKDGVGHVPPRADMSITFIQSESSIIAHGCLYLTGMVSFENNLANFSGTNFQYCLCMCNDPVADAYEPTYFSVFNNGSFDFTATYNFNYGISESGDEKTLAITSATNEQAIYSNIQLANKTFGKSDFTFYPNPVTDFIEIKLSNENIENFKVEFYNGLGQICKTEYPNSNQATIETKSLSPGIYFVKVQNENATVTKKLIKI